MNDDRQEYVREIRHPLKNYDIMTNRYNTKKENNGRKMRASLDKTKLKWAIQRSVFFCTYFKLEDRNR